MEKTIKQGKRSKLAFYLSIMIFPVVQFTIFWIIVNANSLLLSFKEYTLNESGVMINTFVGFKNLVTVYKDLFTAEIFINCIKNSLLFYGVSIAGGTICSLGFSYYIYKKGFLGNFFKVMLYMPHILSTLVIAMMYNYFFEDGLPVFLNELTGAKITKFGDNPMGFIVFFNFIMSFGGNMLIYTGTMAGISDSIIEAAEIDGANSVQEFFHVIMPSIFTTFALFIVTGMITIFNGQANLFNFYGTSGIDKAPNELTLGYWIYIKVRDAKTDYTKYPYLAAFGLALTSFAIPLIFTCRALLKKYGPKED